MEECANMKYKKLWGSSVVIATRLWAGGQKHSIPSKSKNYFQIGSGTSLLLFP
jgi:hypothetical protein